MKKAIVIYDTKFGNTEKIAKAISQGLKEQGLKTDCVEVSKVEVNKLTEYDLLAIGGPTHVFGMSSHIKEFMKKLEEINLQGKNAFAFDTKFKSRFYGSAAKKIEERLRKMQMRIVKPYSSAIVKKIEGSLIEGEKEKFKQLGAEIAKLMI